MVLYSDPADYSPEGMNNTYPKTWWLPGSGTQRGANSVPGDPLTPLLPAIDGVYRISTNDTDALPNIPAQEMTYDDAVEFLKHLKGKAAHNSIKTSTECIADWFPSCQLGFYTVFNHVMSILVSVACL